MMSHGNRENDAIESQGDSAPDFRALFESAPGLYVVLTPDLRIVAVSEAYLHATMTTRDAILNRHLFEVFPDNPNDPDATGSRNLRASLQRVLDTGAMDAMAVQKYDIRRPDSEGGGFEVRHWSPVSSPVFGPAPGRELRYIIHRVKDVTEFVRLKEAGIDQGRLTKELQSRAQMMETEVFLRAQQLQEANVKLRAANVELRENVTQLEQAKSALRESDHSLVLAIAAGDIGTWRWNLKNDTVEMSDRAWQLLGATSDQVTIAEAYRKALHPDDRDRVLAAVERAISTRGEYDMEYRCVHPDGTIRWVAARGRAHEDESGNAAFMQGVVLDITDRKEAELLRRAILVQQRAVADAANRAKSQFLAHMSHEIRTPLNGVIGMTDLLLGTELTDQQRRFIGIARTSAESLMTVINDILDFSKIEAGKMDVVPTEFNLHHMIEDVVDMMAQMGAKKGLEIACHIHPDVPALVRGDSDRLRQILINLLGNAIKFTDRGTVAVRVMSEVIATANRTTVHFSITDTGIGIPLDKIGRLFTAFTQADHSTTRLYGGTGLGLAISKRLAEMMGGSIGVESEPGRGSTFWFKVAMETPAQHDALPPQPIDPATLRVLAVDDNDVQREMLREQIASWGLRAETAADGEQALAMLIDAAAQHRLSDCAAAPFRIAIVDSEMPGMDGFEFALAVQSKVEIRDTVLMLLLPSDHEANIEQLRSMGFAGHMAKPVRQSQLFDAIMNAIAAAKQIPSVVPNAERSKRTTASSLPMTGAGICVLIAEDNEINQIVVNEILAKYGFQCDVVSDGQAALEAVETRRYDLVLMDCQMPGIDGFEATREIRRRERASGLTHQCGRHLPIIALTANAMSGDRERCLEAGMDAYASKPINPKEFLETIETTLGREADAGGAIKEAA